LNRRIASLAAGVVALAALPTIAASQSRPPADSARPTPPAPTQVVVVRPWYERLSLRGYAQFRYNRLLEGNKDLNCQQCDRSIGNFGGFFLRRGRLVFSGDVSNHVSVYIQPDYASDAAGTNHYLQLRDAYFDIFLDSKKEHRLRLGQSKVPYGFENLQSSQNRLPLDRNDGLNSAVPNERDIGVTYYWATTTARRRFRILVDSGLKGSGDYGIVGLGVMNGQTANRPEANNSMHGVARLAYPFRFANGQFMELNVAGYKGRFVLPTRTATVLVTPEYDDERMAVSFIWYAQPIGFQTEWNWGEGPEFDLTTRTVFPRHLRGGYVQAMYRWRGNGQSIWPFVRAQYYEGGKKLEQDARRYEVHEYEGGIEWQASSALELTVEYTRASRTWVDGLLAVQTRQKGGFLRLQAQVNY
jgi:hypothetical protein